MTESLNVQSAINNSNATASNESKIQLSFADAIKYDARCPYETHEGCEDEHMQFRFSSEDEWKRHHFKYHAADPLTKYVCPHRHCHINCASWYNYTYHVTKLEHSAKCPTPWICQLKVSASSLPPNKKSHPTLNQHTVSRSKSDSAEQPVCNKRFGSKYQIKTHILAEHKNYLVHFEEKQSKKRAAREMDDHAIDSSAVPAKKQRADTSNRFAPFRVTESLPTLQLPQVPIPPAPQAMYQDHNGSMDALLSAMHMFSAPVAPSSYGMIGNHGNGNYHNQNSNHSNVNNGVIGAGITNTNGLTAKPAQEQQQQSPASILSALLNNNNFSDLDFNHLSGMMGTNRVSPVLSAGDKANVIVNTTGIPCTNLSAKANTNSTVAANTNSTDHSNRNRNNNATLTPLASTPSNYDVNLFAIHHRSNPKHISASHVVGSPNGSPSSHEMVRNSNMHSNRHNPQSFAVSTVNSHLNHNPLITPIVPMVSAVPPASVQQHVFLPVAAAAVNAVRVHGLQPMQPALPQLPAFMPSTNQMNQLNATDLLQQLQFLQQLLALQYLSQ